MKTALAGLACAAALNVLALAAQAQIPAALGNLPLYFSTAPGPANTPVQFIARGGDYQFLISPAEARLNLQKTGTAAQNISSQTVRMQFVGADSQAQIQGADELTGKINYLVGDNPAQWRTGVATFARVRVGRLYPGVNLVYYGNQRRLEYDFTIASGANPDVIKIRFEGVDKISIGARGELVLALGKDEIRQLAPLIYQTVNGTRKTVVGGYRILGRHTVAFTVGQYDPKLPLVIDPVLTYSTYFGGNSSDAANAIALDTNGFIYIAGQTLSSQFYPTTGAFQTNFAGGSLTGDAFVAKFDNQASHLVYLTYLGGNSDDVALDLAVDDSGDVYVTGYTLSTNFPTYNALYPKIGGTPIVYNGHVYGYNADAFVTELNTNGSGLVYSTYLGGAGSDEGIGIAIDPAGDAYITGLADSTNFPVTTNAWQKQLACANFLFNTGQNGNAFVSEISTGGSNLIYSSYFGGTNFDEGNGIAVDLSNNVYVAGVTASTNFPNTNAFQQYLNGATNAALFYDAFVAKFAPSCTNLVYSSFLGGSNNDAAYRIAVDTNGNAYVTGWTVSTNFPDTATNVVGLYNGLTNNASGLYPYITNAFLTQITYNGTNAAIGYSAVFGGTNGGVDIGEDVALDPSGDAFVVGASSSTSFPATNTPGLLGATNAGGYDAFVIGFNTNCSAIIYSGYFGGSGNDYGYGIAVDSLTNVYIVGQTSSANFPVFNNQGQTSLRGASDAFLAEIGWSNVAPVITDQSSLTNQLLETGQTVTLSVTATGTPPLIYHWQLNGTNLVNGTRISGATNATLTINPVQTNDSGSYQVIVTNYAGSATSSNAILTVTSGPIITVQPTNETVGAGSTAQFNFNATFQQPAFAQWLKDGTNLINGTNIDGSTITGASNSFTLTINNIQTNEDGTYWVIVSNVFGVVASSNATLTVLTFPTILAEPTNQAVGIGSAATFAVNAVGTVPLGYQWQKNGNNLGESGHTVGTTSSALTINNAQMPDDAGYSVIITNSVGSVTSSPPAVLMVLSSPLFGSIISGGTNGGLILTGVGGLGSNTYFVLTSTNLATPLAQWMPIATNQFGSQGQFIFTNLPPTNAPQQFYLLQMQ
ncbi:MAG: SBBP repeat-containing protein [Verrucomicrobiia bacterium]